jgi:hypothetical protein
MSNGDGTLERYRGLRRIHRYGGGRQSDGVWLLEDKRTIAKHFSEKQIDKMKIEIANLQCVRKCSFVPKLLAIDYEHRVLYLNNCGTRPKRFTRDLRQRVLKLMDRLKNKYHLTRKFHKTGLPRIANVTVDANGKVFLIDMGPPFHPSP